MNYNLILDYLKNFDIAVASHTVMAFKLAAKYGTNWMTSGLVGDMMAALSGKAGFEKYVGDNYSSEGDYHKIVEDKLVVTAGDGLGQIAKELFGMTAWNGEFTEEFKAFAEALGKGDNYGLETGDEFDLSSPKVKKFIKDYYKNDPEKIAEFYESNGISLKSNMFVDAVKGALQLGKNSINWGKDKLANIKDNILGMFGPKYVDMNKYLEIDDPKLLFNKYTGKDRELVEKICGSNGNDGFNLCHSVRMARWISAQAKRWNKDEMDIYNAINDKNLSTFFGAVMGNTQYSFNKLPDGYKAMGLDGLIELADWGEMHKVNVKELFDKKTKINNNFGGWLSKYEDDNYGAGNYTLDRSKIEGHAVILSKTEITKSGDFNLYIYDQHTSDKSYYINILKNDTRTFTYSELYQKFTYSYFLQSLDDISKILE